MESKLLGLQALAAYMHFVVKVVALGGRRVGEEVAEPYILGVWLVQAFDRHGPHLVAKVRSF